MKIVGGKSERRFVMGKVVAIKDADSFERIRNELAALGDKYAVMFDVGVGTGLPLNSLLALKVGDVSGKESLPTIAGGEFELPDDLKNRIRSLSQGKSDDAPLFPGRDGSSSPLSRERAGRVLKEAGEKAGIQSVGGGTMRKTFAFRLYEETGDAAALQSALNSPTVATALSFIGEDPLSGRAADAASSRKRLLRNGEGRKRVLRIAEILRFVADGLDDPESRDSFFADADALTSSVLRLANELPSFSSMPKKAERS